MPEVLLAHSAPILVAIVRGLQSKSVELRRAAAMALENAADFCSKHFENPKVMIMMMMMMMMMILIMMTIITIITIITITIIITLITIITIITKIITS